MNANSLIEQIVKEFSPFILKSLRTELEKIELMKQTTSATQSKKDCQEQWSDWSTCSKTCGNGMKTRKREFQKRAARTVEGNQYWQCQRNPQVSTSQCNSGPCQPTRSTQVVKNVENNCKTTSSNDDDSPTRGRDQRCIFPCKVYVEEEKQNRTFDRCTTELCNDCGKFWCSTKVDENGFHTKGNWGYCSASEECLPETKSDFVIRDNFATSESIIGIDYRKTGGNQNGNHTNGGNRNGGNRRNQNQNQPKSFTASKSSSRTTNDPIN